MENTEKITIQNMDGTMEEVTMVRAFNIQELNKDFLILSKGETVGEGMSKIYISEVVEETPGVYKLLGIEDEGVWNQVKEAMKQIVQGEVR